MFEVAEGGEVDGTVGKYANEAHGEATVKGADAIGVPHFAGSREDEGIAVLAALDGFTLHAAGTNVSYFGRPRSSEGWLYNFNVSSGYMENLRSD